jgi:hypothetical protein
MCASGNAYHSPSIDIEALDAYQRGITADLVKFIKSNILKCIFQVSCHSVNVSCIWHSVGTTATFTPGCVEEFKLVEEADVFPRKA